MTHLDTSIADVADLFAVEFLPFLAVELLNERNDVLWPHHIDESVAHIALVLEVNGQVEEVVASAELFINGGEQHLLCVLVGDVLDHQRCAFVLTCKALTLLRRERVSNMTFTNAVLVHNCAAVEPFKSVLHTKPQRMKPLSACK